MNGIDAHIYVLINQTLSAEWLDPIMYYASHKWFWLPLYLFIVIVCVRKFGAKAWLPIACMFLCLLSSDRLTSGVMKPLFNRVRPCHEQSLHPRIIEGVHCSDTGSMASSHAANHFALSVFLILLLRLNGTWRTLLIVWAAFVAYSRVYLGVHYPTDVLVGAGVGTGIAFLIHNLYLKIIAKLQWTL